jgi:hypothetical protein
MKKDYTKDEILKFLLERNYEAIETVLKNGFEVNAKLNENSTGIVLASHLEDIRMVEIFWKYGANPSTQYLQEIEEAFKNGKTYLDFEKPKEDATKYLDLSENFSVRKLEFINGNILTLENGLQNIHIPIAKFVLDDEIVDTSVRLDRISLATTLNNMIGENIEFPINPSEGYIDGSIYLRETHNPVDVTSIKFIKLEDSLITVDLTMNFNFEFEGTGLKNETIIKQLDLIWETELLLKMEKNFVGENRMPDALKKLVEFDKTREDCLGGYWELATFDDEIISRFIKNDEHRKRFAAFGSSSDAYPYFIFLTDDKQQWVVHLSSGQGAYVVANTFNEFMQAIAIGYTDYPFEDYNLPPADASGAKPDFQKWLKENYNLDTPKIGKEIWEKAQTNQKIFDEWLTKNCNYWGE